MARARDRASGNHFSAALVTDQEPVASRDAEFANSPIARRSTAGMSLRLPGTLTPLKPKSMTGEVISRDHGLVARHRFPRPHRGSTLLPDAPPLVSATR